MCTPTKRAFQYILRTNNIPYITYKDVTFIDTVSVQWLPQNDYCTFRDARFPILSYATPKASPATLLKKLVFFRALVQRCQYCNGFRHLPIQSTNSPIK